MQSVPQWTRAPLGAQEFQRLASLVHANCGIALTSSKRMMLEGRLRRRLQANDLTTFAEYLQLLDDPDSRADELQPLIDAVTTNQTAFFREPVHFEYLAKEGITRLLASGGPGSLRAWSAACSSGEEPYTLAMVLAEYQPPLLEGGFSILATDISMTMLQTASRAIYPESDLEEIPHALRNRYFLHAPDRGLVRIVPELRSRVRFGQINLTDRSYRVGGPFDLVFCRNVLIYFDTATQCQVLRQLCSHLREGGILCLGHADTTASVDLPLRLIRANIYERL
jgi:chemotaxis protein methyltransferase CheR